MFTGGTCDAGAGVDLYWFTTVWWKNIAWRGVVVTVAGGFLWRMPAFSLLARGASIAYPSLNSNLLYNLVVLVLLHIYITHGPLSVSFSLLSCVIWWWASSHRANDITSSLFHSVAGSDITPVTYTLIISTWALVLDFFCNLHSCSFYHLIGSPYVLLFEQ